MKFSFASALLLLATCSTAMAFASWDYTVSCDEATPEICRGEMYFQSPSLAMPDPFDENPEPEYNGKYAWDYTFVRGLQDGYTPEFTYPIDFGIYAYGPTVEIEMDVDAVHCTVKVGNETCNTCQLCVLGYWSNEKQNATFSADCTNLQTQHYVAGTGPYLIRVYKKKSAPKTVRF